ncbi:PIG-L deacetylase family protein [Neomicrococcus lactis]|uniref:PIG-L deacetylase family protein n=1 Tax=Neomicrococcus lactis TaxID=732241 RepID=UPI0023005B9E|nr:PIG-L deacetylase family protein [Neomicrococcus lactis]
MSEFQRLPTENIERVLCVAAHPDDNEYGTSAAVHQWVAAGAEVHYLQLTAGEAGMADAPDVVGPLRLKEQQDACREVGVSHLEVLDYPDGAVEYSLALRKDIARYVRQFKPNLVVIGPYDVEAYGSLNQADHRAASLATLDAVRDADNDWCFRELFEEENLPKWHVNAILVTSSDRPTHFVELTAADVDAAVASLNCHKAYLAHVTGHPKPEDFIPPMLAEQGKATGVENALMFRVYDMGGLRREEESESE